MFIQKKIKLKKLNYRFVNFHLSFGKNLLFLIKILIKNNYIFFFEWFNYSSTKELVSILISILKFYEFNKFIFDSLSLNHLSKSSYDLLLIS